MDPFDLSGRVALVTGGGGGIGAAIAEAFAGRGARVVLAGKDEEACAAVAAAIGGDPPPLALVADVTGKEDCERMVARTVERFGRLDVLVACAGINRRKKPEDYAEAEWDAILDVNLKGTFLSCQAAFPALCAAGGGKIITIGSVLSLLANDVTAPYAASKGGVVQLTRSLACAWARHGIQANAILPGWIDTPLSVRARADMPELERHVLERTPAGRWGTPGDLVGAASFLASPASDFVTGVALPVDGGFTIRS